MCQVKNYDTTTKLKNYNNIHAIQPLYQFNTVVSSYNTHIICVCFVDAYTLNTQPLALLISFLYLANL